MKRVVLLIASVCMSLGVLAEIEVSDVTVFSGYPWKEIVVGYTITGSDSEAERVLLTVTDMASNKTYTATTVTGADISEGRHILRWSAASDGVELSSEQVVFKVWVVADVQLWSGGPYWAKCNVGASKPEDSGYYFWWGDTSGYKLASDNGGWVSAKNGASSSYASINCGTSSKDYNTLKSQGYIDSTGHLSANHDAATSCLGAPWRLPTSAEWYALINNCNTKWTTRNGVYGRLVWGKGSYASRSIFLPAAESGREDGLTSAYSPRGFYWSSTPESASVRTFYLFLDSEGISRESYFMSRSNLLCVRPVRGFGE